jgi:hypothetical protein
MMMMMNIRQATVLKETARSVLTIDMVDVVAAYLRVICLFPAQGKFVSDAVCKRLWFRKPVDHTQTHIYKIILMKILASRKARGILSYVQIVRLYCVPHVPTVYGRKVESQTRTWPHGMLHTGNPNQI